jgi:DNA polymerase-3 subunit epsilon
MFDQSIVFLDLETTGGSFGLDRIIEIGVVEIDRGELVGEWSTLVNPGRRVPHAIQVLTGITDEMLAEAPTFAELSVGLYERLQGKVLAAHNARFDYGFLKAELQRAGLPYTAPVLCTVKLSRRLFPQHPRHNLDALIMRHALFCLDRHRALGDARVLWELAQIWRRDIDADTLALACADLLRRPQVPPGLPIDLFDTLPEGPGAYVFYGENDKPLYVGKSANVRSRVLVHFTGERASAKDSRIAAEVKRVESIETAGELGAHFEAARLAERRGSSKAPRSKRSASRICTAHFARAPPRERRCASSRKRTGFATRCSTSKAHSQASRAPRTNRSAAAARAWAWNRR